MFLLLCFRVTRVPADGGCSRALLFRASEGGKKDVNSGRGITGEHDYSLLVNLLCDLVEVILGGVCQQLWGSEQMASGSVQLLCFIAIFLGYICIF